jgi:hypothetical protein
MKKQFNLAIVYAISAMVGGVFFREFTKWNGFDGVTALGKVHVHLFILGMLVFLITALFSQRYPLDKVKSFRIFMVLYNVGVPLTAIMLLVRGIFQVLGTTLTPGADAVISGIAGIGHILTGVGLILWLLSLKKAALSANSNTNNPN